MRTFLVLLLAALCCASANARETKSQSLSPTPVVRMQPHTTLLANHDGPITIPLMRTGASPEKRAEVLLKLKMRQTNMLSLLETGNIKLEEEILSEKHLATYFGRIKIDNHEFKVLFDTGSCEFWVPSTECETARCKKHSRFPWDPNNAQLAATTALNIQYLSGKVAGDMVFKNVTLGDIHVSNQVVGLAKVVDIDLLDDVKWDGILGLAYANPTLRLNKISPIFDTIVNSRVLSSKGLANQFGYYIDDVKGSVTFGGADCDHLNAKGEACIEKFGFVPVTEKTYWTVHLRDVRVKYPGKPEINGHCPAGGCKAIVDTGTYLIYGPESQVAGMLTKPLQSCRHHGDMPTFTFDFHVGHDAKPVSLTLNPIDYILKFNNNKQDECVVGISPDKDVIWTLGQVFLRTFYTVFDRDEDRIGFARVTRTKFNAINHRLPNSLIESHSTADRKHSPAFMELKDRVAYDPADEIDDF